MLFMKLINGKAVLLSFLTSFGVDWHLLAHTAWLIGLFVYGNWPADKHSHGSMKKLPPF